MFAPPRTRGLLIQGFLCLLFLTGAVFALLAAFEQVLATRMALFMLLSLILATPAGVLLYRIYGLLFSSYTVSREGLRLRWGLRAEDIPIQSIEWIQPAAGVVPPLRLPRLAWIGALRGNVISADLGLVEYIAAERSTLLLVATPKKVYAISPSQPDAFVEAFQEAFEAGTLESLTPYSMRTAVSLRRVWHDRPARVLILSGAGLALAVFLLISLGTGTRQTISLGIDPSGAPLEPVPVVQAMLLPFLAGTAFTLDLVLGLLAYRKETWQPLAYLIWLGGALSGLVFLIASFFLL